jgi:hypothetical protein
MLQNIPKEKILEVVRQGPTVPSKIVKIVGGDTMLIGAMLSGMIGAGEVKISTLKMGGSPVYYIPGQEEKLEDFIQYLNEKDQRTVRDLKEARVIQDSKQDPLIRFSLKTIKDFAKQFEIRGQMFYRYFLVNKEDAERVASDMLKEQEVPPQEVMLNKNSTALDKEVAIQHAVSKEPVEIQSNTGSETIGVEPKRATHTSEVPVKIAHDVKGPKEPKELKELKEPKESKELKTDFFESIKSHVHKLGLDIVGKEKIKKTEYALILKNHDSNEYHYCVAKDKKTINEGDLSTAFVFAHQKKMPCIFLMTGKLSKKAEAMSQKEFVDMKIDAI